MSSQSVSHRSSEYSGACLESDCESPEVVTRWVRTLQLIPNMWISDVIVRGDYSTEWKWNGGSEMWNRFAKLGREAGMHANYYASCHLAWMNQ